MSVLAAIAACAVASGCTSEGEPTPRPTPSSVAIPGPITDEPAPAQIIGQGQADAERIRATIGQRLDVHVTEYGEGSKSPCTPAATELFTDACHAAGESVRSIAQAALAEIEEKRGFKTLRDSSRATVAAFDGYTESKCSDNPQTSEDRSKCVNYGATLAQAPSDLRDGLRLALTGN